MKSTALFLVCIVSAFVSSVELAKPFEYEDCSKDGHHKISNITQLTLSPDPLSFSKDLTVTVNISLHEDIPPNAFIRTKVYKISLFGIHVPAPCWGGIGSCTTEHCKFMNTFKDQACPFFPGGRNCSCPMKAGYYEGSNVTVSFPDLGPLLKFFASGKYEIKMELFVKEKYKEKMLACYKFTGTAKP